MDVITTKKNQEWLLVYVAGQETRKGGSYLGLKTSVYDKIKNDFNVGKRDRYDIFYGAFNVRLLTIEFGATDACI